MCSIGVASSVNTNANGWTWTCAGSNGGTTAYCTAYMPDPDPEDGVCGSVHETFVSSKPTSNLCSVGAPSTVGGNGPWNWSCEGLY